MTEIAQRTPIIVREFMNRADDFINAEDTLKVSTAPQRKELEQGDKKVAGQKGMSNCERGTKGVLEAKR